MSNPHTYLKNKDILEVLKSKDALEVLSPQIISAAIEEIDALRKEGRRINLELLDARRLACELAEEHKAKIFFDKARGGLFAPQNKYECASLLGWDCYEGVKKL